MTPRYVRYVEVMLFAAVAMEFLQRQLLAIAVEPLRADLGVSDTEIGTLLAAFAVVYSVLALPLGRLADRSSRRTIYAACIAVWSVATAAGAAAASYLPFLGTRLVVGAGQAGAGACLAPLVADYVAPLRRATSLAVISVGATVGTFAAMGAGGPFIEAFGWRTAFAAAGGLGLVFAALFAVTVREPARGWSEGRQDEPGAAPSLGEVVRTLRASRPLVHLAIAGSYATATVMAAAQWAPAFFQRAHGLSIQKAGLVLGFVAIVGTVGIAGGGILADRRAARDPRAPLLVSATGSLLSVPVLVSAYLVGDTRLAIALSLLGIPLALAYSAPLASVAQSLAPLRMRAVAAGTIAALLTLVGSGAGTLVTGALSDGLAAWRGRESLGLALALMSLLQAGAGMHFLLAARALPAPATTTVAPARAT